jgi:hypothetical protein
MTMLFFLAAVCSSSTPTRAPKEVFFIANLAYAWRNQQPLKESEEWIYHVQLFFDSFPILMDQVERLFSHEPPVIDLKCLTRDEKIDRTFHVMSQFYLKMGIFTELPPIIYRPVYLVSEFVEIFMEGSKPLSNKTETGSRNSGSDPVVSDNFLRDRNNQLAKILLGEKSVNRKNINEVNSMLDSFERIISGVKVYGNFQRHFSSLTPMMKAERIDRVFLYVWDVYCQLHQSNLNFLNDRVVGDIPESYIALFSAELGNIGRVLHEMNLQIPPITKYKIFAVISSIGVNINSMFYFFTEDESSTFQEVSRVLSVITEKAFADLYGAQSLEKDIVEKQSLMMECVTEKLTLSITKTSSKEEFKPFKSLLPELETRVAQRCRQFHHLIVDLYPELDETIFTKPVIDSDSVEALTRKAKKLFKWWRPIYEVSHPGSTKVIDFWKSIMEEIKKRR